MVKVSNYTHQPQPGVTGKGSGSVGPGAFLEEGTSGRGTYRAQGQSKTTLGPLSSRLLPVVT